MASIETIKSIDWNHSILRRMMAAVPRKGSVHYLD